MTKTLLGDCIDSVKRTKMSGWRTSDKWGVATLQSIAERILEQRSLSVRFKEETIIDMIAALVATGAWTVEDGIDECRKWFGE